MRTDDPKHLICTNGHQVTVLWGRPVPLCCPACVFGIPCEMPLRPLRQENRTSTARSGVGTRKVTK